ncbi:hypothetical protein FZEAL_1836 [Fusarium zealandicum]|uniref:Involucrin repeat protein n=1 Tax=Fusarium zealandicum TaxID=1053134 RepID=A0A8H4USP8_9HYPO|nr:hypothetical protein FZEAL_1836 [Fusarium zealandicum]
MMRDNRSRDPEGARRRWYESRDSRDSRQQSPQQPQQQPQPQYPQQQYQQQRHEQPHQQTQMYQQPYKHQQYQQSPQQYQLPQQYQQPQPYTSAPPVAIPAYNVPYQPRHDPQRPQTPSSVFSSSSDTSSSLLDISRYKDTKTYGGVLTGFFKAPSDRAKQRRHKKKKRRVLYFGNSSSSSVNSDLAYGQGYVKQPKSRTLSPRSRNSIQGYSSAQGHAHGHGQRRHDVTDASDYTPRQPPRKKTADEEIMALGQQLTNLARRSERDELRHSSRGSGKGKAAALGLAAGAAGAAMASQYDRQQGGSRGAGGSKPRVNSSDDDSDWEDASDDESSSSDDAGSAADPELAYGTTLGQSVKPAVGAAAAAASASAAAAMAGHRTHSSYQSASEYHRYGDRSSVVDPRLFGPYNSLRGSINTPCGFREEERTSSYRQSSGSVPTGPIQMRDTYPVPTSDPIRFDIERTSVVTPRQDLTQQSRPAPVPLQQPVPKVPVSSKVYNAEKYEDVSRRDSRYTLQGADEKSWGGAAAAGLAAAAVGAAVASSSYSRKESREYRKDDKHHRDSKRPERDEEKPFDRERLELERRQALEVEQRKLDELERQKTKELARKVIVELEGHHSREADRQRDQSWEPEREDGQSKRDASYTKYIDERDHEKSSRLDDHDDTHKDRKEKKEKRKFDVVVAPQQDRNQGTEFRIKHGPEFQVMGEPVLQVRDSDRSVPEEGRELPLPTGAGHQVVARTSRSTQPVDPVFDPFQYQVSDDAFTMSQTTTPKRPLTPNVVTVDREPNFDDSPPRTSAVDARLSRRDSFEIERMVEEYRKGTQDASHYQDPRIGHEYQEEEHQAKSILDEAKHATAPVAAAAFASAIAVEQERSRERRGSSRPRRDAVQEEADRYYREACIARKIASDEMRSRSASPEPSVVDKWQDDKYEPIAIVTPPDMEDKHLDKSVFDAPDADVKIDNKIYPREANLFRNVTNPPQHTSRTRNLSRERPVLNLIYPTPVPSRQPTPAPKKIVTITREPEETSSRSEITPNNVVIGPKGEVMAFDEPLPVGKSVTWGENETKSFEVETPDTRSDSENYFRENSDRPSDKPRPRLNKSSRWGILAAAIAGSSAEPVNEPDVEIPASKGSEIPRSSPKESSREVVPVHSAQVFGDETSREPPIPGPKPASPRPDQMPGGYADDLEFAATLAAGLKDTGFDPEIVIDDPSYRRRESPPGMQEANGDTHGSANGSAWYKRPHVETVSDATETTAPKLLPKQGLVLGEVETPQEKTRVPLDSQRGENTVMSRELDNSESPRAEDVPLPDEVLDVSRLSKRDQRKRDKSEVVVVQDDGKAEIAQREPTPPRETGEEVWEDVARKRGKKNRKNRDFDDESSRVSAPVGHYQDTPSSRDVPGKDAKSHDGWDTPQDVRRTRNFDASDIARAAAPAIALGAWSAYNDRSSKDAEAEEAGHDQWNASARPSSWASPEGVEWAASQVSSPSRSYSKDLSRDVPTREARSDDELDVSKKSRKQWKDEEYYNDDDRSRASAGVKSSHRRHSSRDVSSRDVRSDDERDDAQRSRKHKKDRDSRHGDDQSRILTTLEPTDRRSSRRRSSRDRSRNRSRDRSRHKRSDDELDTPKKPRRSKRDSYGLDSPGLDSPTRSVVASEISVGSSASKRSKKSKRKSGTEEDWREYEDSPTDRRRDHFDDRDVSSVVSESRGDDRRKDSGHRRKSSRYDDDDVKSVASMPGSSRKDKDYKDRRDPEKRSSGVLSSLFKSSRKEKKDSFLDNAGTLGAGVGLASAAAAIASDAARSNAGDAPLNQEHDVSRGGRRVRSYETFDPEVAPRLIKPAIDPQYGDLLPLPPSEPGSPSSGPEELPSLPDSRPDTPPEERVKKRDIWTHQRRRSAFDTPTKSPSLTAVPFQLRLGQRSNPASPVGFKPASPASSPVVSHSDAGATPRRAARPTSWDSSREIKPLYLLEEHSRHAQPTTGSSLPALPPSEPSESSAMNSPGSEAEFLQRNDDYFGLELDDAQFSDPALHIDTTVFETLPKGHGDGSQETTPRAEFKPELPISTATELGEPEPRHDESAKEAAEPSTPEPMPVEPTSRDMVAELLAMTPTPLEAAAAAFPAALVATALGGEKKRTDSPADNTDDLTSADEHFTDAIEGESGEQSPWEMISNSHDSSLNVEPLGETRRELPDTEFASQLVDPSREPTAEPVIATVEEPTIEEHEVASGAIVEGATKSMEEAVSEPVTETATQPVVEPSTEETPRELPIEPVTNDTPELVIEDVTATESAPQLAVEPVTEMTTDAAPEIIEPFDKSGMDTAVEVPGKTLQSSKESTSKDVSGEMSTEPAAKYVNLNEAASEPANETVETVSREVESEPVGANAPATTLTPDLVTEPEMQPAIVTVDENTSAAIVESLEKRGMEDKSREANLELAVEDVSEPHASTKALKQPASEPLTEAVAKPAEAEIKAPAEQTTETAPQRAENEFTTEEWQNLAAKDRKSMRKKLRKKGQEPIIQDSFETTTTPVQVASKDEQVAPSEETVPKDEYAETQPTIPEPDVSADSSAPLITETSATPVAAETSESEASHNVLSETPEVKDSPSRPVNDQPATERDLAPETPIETDLKSLPAEDDPAKEPEVFPAELVTEAEPSNAEERAEPLATGTDEAAEEPAQPQSKKSKKKKKKGKAQPTANYEPALEAPVVAEPDATTGEVDKDSFDAWAEPDTSIEPPSEAVEPQPETPVETVPEAPIEPPSEGPAELSIAASLEPNLDADAFDAWAQPAAAVESVDTQTSPDDHSAPALKSKKKKKKKGAMSEEVSASDNQEASSFPETPFLASDDPTEKSANTEKSEGMPEESTAGNVSPTPVAPEVGPTEAIPTDETFPSKSAEPSLPDNGLTEETPESKEVDVAVRQSTKDDSDQFVDTEELSAPVEVSKPKDDGVTYSPSATGLHSPPKDVQEPKQGQGYFPSALRALPATGGFSAWKKMWGYGGQSKDLPQSTESKPEEIDDKLDDQRDLGLAEESAQLTAEKAMGLNEPEDEAQPEIVGEKTETIANKPDVPSAEPERDVTADNVAPTPLESHVSEPLFSQGDAPFEESQASSVGMEPSQVEGTIPPAEELGRAILDKDASAPATEEESANTTENGASAQPEESAVMSQDDVTKPMETEPDKTTDEPTNTAVEESAKTTEDVEDKPAVTIESTAPDDAVPPTPTPETTEADAPVSKKTKKKKKKKNQASEVEAPEEEEAKEDVSKVETKEEPRVDQGMPEPIGAPTETDVPTTTDTTASEPLKKSIPDTMEEPRIEERSTQLEATEDVPVEQQIEKPASGQPSESPRELADNLTVDEPQREEISDADRAAKDANESEDKAAHEAEEAEAALEHEEIASLLEKRTKRKGRLLKKDQARLTLLEGNATKRSEARAAREAEEQAAQQTTEAAAIEAADEEPVEGTSAAPTEIEVAHDHSAEASETNIVDRTSEDTEAQPNESIAGDTQTDINQTTDSLETEVPSEVPVLDKTDKAGLDTGDVTPAAEPQEGLVEGEPVDPVSGKKSKKNKKKKKSVSFTEANPAQNPPLEGAESSSLAQEPEQLDLSTADTGEPPAVKEATSSQPVEDAPANALSTEVEQSETSHTTSPAEDLDKSESVEANPEGVEDKVAGEPEAEAPAEKKSKKNKKKKKNASSSDDVEKQPEGDSMLSETSGPISQEDPTTNPEESKSQDDAKGATTQQASSDALDKLDHGGEPVEAQLPTDEDAPPLGPEEMKSVPEVVPASDAQSQPADVETPVETPPVQEPAMDAQVTDAPAAPDTDQPPTEPTAPTTEDADSAATAKLSKKDKKKKKKAEKKKAAVEDVSEPASGLATPSEDAPGLEVTDSPAETSTDPRDDIKAEPETSEATGGETAPDGEPATPADDTNLPDTTESGEQSVPGQEPVAGPKEDERGGFSLKQSQTDTKNKTKDNDFEILQDPETNRPTEPKPEPEKQDVAETAVDDAGSLGPSDNDKREEDKSMAGDLAALPEPEAELESELGLEAEKQGDDEGDAGLSKKQKKKEKQKAEALAALESSADPETPKEAEASPEQPTEPAVETGIESELKPEPETKPAFAEPDDDSGPKNENETLPEVEETVPIVEPDTEAESKSETETQPVVNLDAQSAVEPTTVEPEVEADAPTSEPESETQTIPVQEIIVPDPEIESGVKQAEVETEPDTKVTAEQGSAPLSGSQPEVLSTPTERLDEPSGDVESREATAETGQPAIVPEPEPEFPEKPSEDSTPVLSKKEKKRQKKQKAQADAEEVSKGTGNANEAEPSGSVNETSPGVSPEAAVEPVPEPAIHLISEPTGEIPAEPVIESVDEQITSAPEPESAKSGDAHEPAEPTSDTAVPTTEEIEPISRVSEPVSGTTEAALGTIKDGGKTNKRALESSESLALSRPPSSTAPECLSEASEPPDESIERTAKHETTLQTIEETQLEPQLPGVPESATTPTPDVQAAEDVPEAQAEQDKDFEEADLGLSKKEIKKLKKKVKNKNKGRDAEASEEQDKPAEVASAPDSSAADIMEPQAVLSTQPEHAQSVVEIETAHEPITQHVAAPDFEIASAPSSTPAVATDAEPNVTKPKPTLQVDSQTKGIEAEVIHRFDNVNAAEEDTPKPFPEPPEHAVPVSEIASGAVEKQGEPKNAGDEADQSHGLSKKDKKKNKKGKDSTVDAPEDPMTLQEGEGAATLPTESIESEPPREKNVPMEESSEPAERVLVTQSTDVTRDKVGQTRPAEPTDNVPSAEPTKPIGANSVVRREIVEPAEIIAPIELDTSEQTGPPHKDAPVGPARSVEPTGATEPNQPEGTSQSTQLPESELETPAVLESVSEAKAEKETQDEDATPATLKKNKKQKKKAKKTSEDTQPTAEPDPTTSAPEIVAEPAAKPAESAPEIIPEPPNDPTEAIDAKPQAEVVADTVSEDQAQSAPEPIPDLVIDPPPEPSSEPKETAPELTPETIPEPRHLPEEEPQPKLLEAEDVLGSSVTDADVETTPSTEPVIESAAQPRETPDDTAGLSNKEKKRRKKKAKDLLAASEKSQLVAENAPASEDTLVKDLANVEQEPKTELALGVDSVPSVETTAQKEPNAEAQDSSQAHIEASREPITEAAPVAEPRTEPTAEISSEAKPAAELFGPILSVVPESVAEGPSTDASHDQHSTEPAREVATTDISQGKSEQIEAPGDVEEVKISNPTEMEQDDEPSLKKSKKKKSGLDGAESSELGAGAILPVETEMDQDSSAPPVNTALEEMKKVEIQDRQEATTPTARFDEPWKTENLSHRIEDSAQSAGKPDEPTDREPITEPIHLIKGDTPESELQTQQESHTKPHAQNFTAVSEKTTVSNLDALEPTQLEVGQDESGEKEQSLQEPASYKKDKKKKKKKGKSSALDSSPTPEPTDAREGSAEPMHISEPVQLSEPSAIEPEHNQEAKDPKTTVSNSAATDLEVKRELRLDSVLDDGSLEQELQSKEEPGRQGQEPTLTAQSQEPFVPGARTDPIQEQVPFIEPSIQPFTETVEPSAQPAVELLVAPVVQTPSEPAVEPPALPEAENQTEDVSFPVLSKKEKKKKKKKGKTVDAPATDSMAPTEAAVDAGNNPIQSHPGEARQIAGDLATEPSIPASEQPDQFNTTENEGMMVDVPAISKTDEPPMSSSIDAAEPAAEQIVEAEKHSEPSAARSEDPPVSANLDVPSEKPGVDEDTAQVDSETVVPVSPATDTELLPDALEEAHDPVTTAEEPDVSAHTDLEVIEDSKVQTSRSDSSVQDYELQPSQDLWKRTYISSGGVEASTKKKLKKEKKAKQVSGTLTPAEVDQVNVKPVEEPAEPPQSTETVLVQDAGDMYPPSQPVEVPADETKPLDISVTSTPSNKGEDREEAPVEPSSVGQEPVVELHAQLPANDENTRELEGLPPKTTEPDAAKEAHSEAPEVLPPVESPQPNHETRTDGPQSLEPVPPTEQVDEERVLPNKKKAKKNKKAKATVSGTRTPPRETPVVPPETPSAKVATDDIDMKDVGEVEASPRTLPAEVDQPMPDASPAMASPDPVTPPNPAFVVESNPEPVFTRSPAIGAESQSKHSITEHEEGLNASAGTKEQPTPVVADDPVHSKSPEEPLAPPASTQEPVEEFRAHHPPLSSDPAPAVSNSSDTLIDSRSAQQPEIFSPVDMLTTPISVKEPADLPAPAANIDASSFPEQVVATLTDEPVIPAPTPATVPEVFTREPALPRSVNPTAEKRETQGLKVKSPKDKEDRRTAAPTGNLAQNLPLAQGDKPVAEGSPNRNIKKSKAGGEQFLSLQQPTASVTSESELRKADQPILAEDSVASRAIEAEGILKDHRPVTESHRGLRQEQAAEAIDVPETLAPVDLPSPQKAVAISPALPMDDGERVDRTKSIGKFEGLDLHADQLSLNTTRDSATIKKTEHSSSGRTYSMTEPPKTPEAKEKIRSPPVKDDTPAAISDIATAIAAASGVASVADRASKKKSKGKKTADKRTQPNDDMIDDQALLETVDKKAVKDDGRMIGDVMPGQSFLHEKKRLDAKEDTDLRGRPGIEDSIKGDETTMAIGSKDSRPRLQRRSNDVAFGMHDEFYDGRGATRGTKETRDMKTQDDFWRNSSDQKETSKEIALVPEDEGRATDKKPKQSRKGKDSTPSKGDAIITNKPRKDKHLEREKDQQPKSATGSFNKPEGVRKETPRQGIRSDSYDTMESPILGRGNMELSLISPQGLLRRGSDVEEPRGGLLREESQRSAPLGDMGSEISELRRSPARLLPPVQEVPEAETELAKGPFTTPNVKRDSGLAGEASSFQRRKQLSEEPQRDNGFGGETPTLRRSKRPSQEPLRDSGVHSGDWTEKDQERAMLRTPEPPGERRLRRSPRGTPVLREPPAAGPTPEPEKKERKQYGTLTPAGAVAAAAAAAGAGVGLAALRGPSTPAPTSSADSQRSASDNAPPSRQSTPRLEGSGRRSVSNTSLSRRRTPEPLKFRPESPGINRASGTPTPPLRRVDKRMSGDLRALRQQNNTTPANSNSTPIANEGRARAKDMADVYDGFGEGRIGSPRSPTRPHSMRRRQSMQVLELENKVEQLLEENRMLTDARASAETNLSQRAATSLADRDAEIDNLKQSLQFLQNEVSRLTEVNDGLTSANAELANKDSGRVADLEARHATITRELEEARHSHGDLDQSLEAKDAEIAELRAQLDSAKEKIRELQRQILETKASDEQFLNLRDEDHFDHRCQQLCSHVQQWVLRFSKFSDMRACRLTSEINDEKTIDRLDNAILDGSDVDSYLRDRVKRRDIFMSMTMNMIWEFVFTRYLFGMDREQRQKLKSLEKLLTEVGPPKAVRQWRAVTLTLLAKRDSFKRQRDLDTEAVVQAIFQNLCKILPPPSNLEDQIQSQLRRVMREAVGLSIEMRTQKAEYMMLPPLRPEYDADGELSATVQFNASMMNERSSSVTISNEDLEAQGAVVRVVLFPLVVKKGDDSGHGDEEIVVCPAQVHIARSKNLFPASSDARGSDIGGTSFGARSHISLVTENMGMSEVDY